MTENLMLAAIYENWETYQNQLIAALAPLSDEQLTLRTAPDLRSIGETATHMVAVRVRWFHDALKEDAGALAPVGAWDRSGQPVRTAPELVEGFRQSWEFLRAALDRWTPADLATPIAQVYHGEAVTLQRPWVAWHVLEHDLHHGGEISLTLGTHGLTAPDI